MYDSVMVAFTIWGPELVSASRAVTDEQLQDKDLAARLVDAIERSNAAGDPGLIREFTDGLDEQQRLVTICMYCVAGVRGDDKRRRRAELN